MCEHLPTVRGFDVRHRMTGWRRHYVAGRPSLSQSLGGVSKG